MEAARTSETSVNNYFTRQYIPEDKSEHHTRRRENLKSHCNDCSIYIKSEDEPSDNAVCSSRLGIHDDTPTNLQVNNKTSQNRVYFFTIYSVCCR
jgi:hypothetical protein